MRRRHSLKTERRALRFLLEPARSRAADPTARGRAISTRLEMEQKSLAAADVSQRFLIRPVKELIAQSEPAAQLWWRGRSRTRPTLTREACVEFRELRVLSQGQQSDSRAFRHRQFKIPPYSTSALLLRRSVLPWLTDT